MRHQHEGAETQGRGSRRNRVGEFCSLSLEGGRRVNWLSDSNSTGNGRPGNSSAAGFNGRLGLRDLW
jgi:hypothetical protein